MKGLLSYIPSLLFGLTVLLILSGLVPLIAENIFDKCKDLNKDNCEYQLCKYKLDKENIEYKNYLGHCLIVNSFLNKTICFNEIMK